jgi:hypothetical protein
MNIGLRAVSVAVLLSISAGAHARMYQCGEDIVYSNGQQGIMPRWCETYEPPPPPTYNWYGALAMDEHGMAYGIYTAPGGFISSKAVINPRAVKECEAAKPFSPCKVVATVTGGVLVLVWDAQQGKAFWATGDDDDQAQQKALAQCGSSSCQVAATLTSPRGTLDNGQGSGRHGWLPGDNHALTTAIMQRQKVSFFNTQVGLKTFGFVTTSASYTQKQDAQRSAEEFCRAGGQGACTVLQTFADTCGAVAYAKYQGKPQYFTATDADPKQAEQKAFRQCVAKFGDNDCYYFDAQCAGLQYGERPAYYAPPSEKGIADQKRWMQQELERWPKIGEATRR